MSSTLDGSASPSCLKWSSAVHWSLISTAPMLSQMAPSNAHPLRDEPLLSHLITRKPCCASLCARMSAVVDQWFVTLCTHGPPYTATTVGYGPSPYTNGSGLYTQQHRGTEPKLPCADDGYSDARHTDGECVAWYESLRQW